MKAFTIKYQTYDNEVKTVTISAYDVESAKTQLINCKEIYWITGPQNRIY